jgi:hypothetical protein
MINKLELVKSLISQLTEEESSDLFWHMRALNKYPKEEKEPDFSDGSWTISGWDELGEQTKKIKIDALLRGECATLPSDSPEEYLKMENCETYEIGEVQLEKSED